MFLRWVTAWWWHIRHDPLPREILLAEIVTTVMAFFTGWWEWLLVSPAGVLLLRFGWSVHERNWSQTWRLIMDEYRIRGKWRSACEDAKLDQQILWPMHMFRGRLVDGRWKDVPRIKHIEHKQHSITVHAERMNQPDNAWRHWLPELAGELGYQVPRFEAVGRTTVSLGFSRYSTWPEAFEVDAPTRPVNLRQVPLAKTGTGEWFNVPVLGSHVLICGATGSGKGSVIWQMATSLKPHIERGTAQLWGIDPKRVELSFGGGLFTRLAVGGDPNEDQDWMLPYVELLEDAVEITRARQARMEGASRLIEPSPAEPLIVIVIDELVTFMHSMTPPLKRRTKAALTFLLPQGRAVGVAVWAATQLMSKEVLGIFRDLFPVRIALRMTERTHVDMALGAGAVTAGADPHLLPDTGAEGVAYVLRDGRSPVMVRFPWWSDQVVQDTAASVQLPTAVRSIPAYRVNLVKRPRPVRDEFPGWFAEHPGASAQLIMAAFKVPRSTAYRWLKEERGKARDRQKAMAG